MNGMGVVRAVPVLWFCLGCSLEGNGPPEGDEGPFGGRILLLESC